VPSARKTAGQWLLRQESDTERSELLQELLHEDGHAANGHTGSNGHAANGHTGSNGHAANGHGIDQLPSRSSDGASLSSTA